MHENIWHEELEDSVKILAICLRFNRFKRLIENNTGLNDLD